MVSTLTVASVSTVAQAAILRPLVIHRAGTANLPTTPAYRAAAVTHDLKTLSSTSRPRTVDVIVDSPSRVRALEAYSQSVSQPGNPNYHHFLTPKALDQAFGPTPAMISEARSSIRAAGWQLIAVKGLVATARVPGAQSRPGLPVSPDIWSMTGLSPHGIVRRPSISQAKSRAAITIAGDNFQQSPVATDVHTNAATNDTVTVMSWNPNIKTSLPTGLPTNLFATVQDAAGNALPIQSVTHVGDTENLVGYYQPQAMPGSSNTLWQVPVAAVQDVPTGDRLSLTITLSNGQVVTGHFPLPAFTGKATALSPLNGEQMNTLSGMSNPPSKTGAVALFAMGTPPNLSDVADYLNQNASPVSVPPVHFHYLDGAVAGQYGNTSDSEESQVDLEAVAGSAPGATIEDYVFPENDTQDPLISFLTALGQQSTAKIASISYGFFGEDPATLTTLMDTLTAEGITVLEASGDQGAWDNGQDPGPVGLSSLEQIPSVLTVGGLDMAAPATLNAKGTTGTITGPAVVRAWGGDYLNGLPTAIAQDYTNYDAASSGGYSATTPVPSWQVGFVPASAPGLGSPIISSLAGYPALSGYFQGQNAPFMGTSVASPLTAGWLADAEATLNVSSTGLGNLNPLLFKGAHQDPNLFTQALWGTNGVYQVSSAESGTWNPVTGLGMVNWATFIRDFNTLSPQSHPALTVNISSNNLAGHIATVSASTTGMLNPTYEFWVEYPSGWWRWGGKPSTKSHLTFTPNVPGRYRVRVRVTDDNGTTLTKTLDVNVTSTSPMVSGIHLTANPPWLREPPGRWVTFHTTASDTGANPRYQFRVRGPSGPARIVQSYSSNPNLVLKNLKPGSYLVIASALDQAQINAKHWGQAFRITKVLYVGSWIANFIPHQAAKGRLLTLRAQAHNITRPEYQFVVRRPNGTVISSPHNMTRNFWSFIPSIPGTYHITIYAKDGGASQAIGTKTTVWVP